MKIELWLIGKTSFSFVQEGIDEYQKRLQKWLKFEVVLLKDSKLQIPEMVKKHEAEIVLKKLQESDILILLDERGEKYNSLKFSHHIEQIQQNKKVIFLIGGAFGFDDSVYRRATQKISFSEMTFSHQIIRLMFMEQIYRAYSILNGQPYHHE
jgi:23S rRNA (pseudouridine1915-N3)-methyltransferase